MSKVFYNGELVAEIEGLPKVGDIAQDFYTNINHLLKYTKKIREKKIIVLNILPDFVQEDISKKSIAKFHQQYQNRDDVMVLNVVSMTAFNSHKFINQGKDIAFLFQAKKFAKDYGVKLKFHSQEFAAEGLVLARSVIVIDKTGRIAYTQLVDDLCQEPQYDICFHCVETLPKEAILVVDKKEPQEVLKSVATKEQQNKTTENKSKQDSLQKLVLKDISDVETKEDVSEALANVYLKTQGNFNSGYVHPFVYFQKNLFQLFLMQDINRLFEEVLKQFSVNEENSNTSNSLSLTKEMKNRSQYSLEFALSFTKKPMNFKEFVK
jgi:thioredoxin-dependent peroxiredoxin